MARNEVKIVFSGDTKGLSRATSAAESSVQSLEQRFEKSGKRMAETGARLTKAITLPVLAVAAVSIKAASDLEQSIGGTQAVFGKSSKIIDKWAKDSARSMGLSERAFRQATTQIGAQLKGMGFDLDEAADKSVELTRLGADLAATFGGTTTEAVTALSAALRGEFDPLEKYGISLRASDIAARAVAMGLADSTTKVGTHAKAVAALAIINEQSADAQGQFGRESATFAGQLQILKAEVEDTGAAVGQVLLPPAVALLGVLKGLASGLSDIPPPLRNVIVGFALVAAAIPPLVWGVGNIIQAALKLKTAWGVVEGALAGKSIAKAVTSIGMTEGAAAAAAPAVAGLGTAFATMAAPLAFAVWSIKGAADAERAQTKTAKELARQLLAGGASAAAARPQIQAYRDDVKELTEKRQRLIDAPGSIGLSTDEIIRLSRGQNILRTLGQEIEKNKNVKQSAANIDAQMALAQENLNEVIARYGPNSAQAVAATKVYKEAQGDVEKQQRDVATATQSVMDKELELANQRMAFVDSSLAYEGQQRALNEAIDDQKVKQDAAAASGYTNAEANKALDESTFNLKNQIDSTADAAARLASDRLGPGATADQKAKAGSDAYLTSLYGQSQSAIPAVRDQALLLIGTYGQIPPVVNTTVNVNTDEAHRRIRVLQASLGAFYTSPEGKAILAGANAGTSPRKRGAAAGGVFPGRAGGGTLPSGPFWVGERGPELIVPEFAGRVLNHGDSMRASSSGGGSTVNVIVNAGMGADGGEIGAQIVTAIKNYERRSGTRWRS